MTVGDVMSALIKYASDWNRDNLLLLRSVYSIEVHKNTEIQGYEIEINFVDANTRNVIIDEDGRFMRFAD